MKVLIAGEENNLKDLIFALKYENMIREICVFLPEIKANNNNYSSFFAAFKLLHTDTDLQHFIQNESPLFIVTSSDSRSKRKLYEKLKSYGGIPISFFSSNSLISRDNIISNKNVIIQVHCDVSADVTLSEGVELGSQSLIGHDVKVGAFTTIGKKAAILGYVEIGENCSIGHGVTIMPSVIIGNNVVISSNQVIKKSVPDNATI